MNKNPAYYSLLIVMFVLLLQSGITLLFPIEIVEGFESVDIVFRTSLSSIFGYFISLVWSDSNKKNEITTTPTSTNPDLEQDISKQEEEIPKRVFPPKPRLRISTTTQILIITGICLYCLIVIILCRNFSTMITLNQNSSATLLQYRDFISGSIGALIGLSKSNTTNTTS